MQKFVAIMHIQNILTKLYSKQILFKIISIILSFMLDKVTNKVTQELKLLSNTFYF